MKTFTTTNVGNEYFDNNKELTYSFDIPEIIDYLLDNSFGIPSYPGIAIYTGYLYFNLTIETFGYGLWRGSELIAVPNRIMVFPSAYKLNNTIYWGTDFQPNFATVKNSFIGFFGLKERDVLADWGFYDAQYIHFLKDMAAEWINLMHQYGEEWNNYLLENNKTLNVARGMEYASNVMDAISHYGINGLVQLAKDKLGDTFEYIKDNPEAVFSIALSYAVEEATGAILAGAGLSAGLAFVGALLVGATLPIDEAIEKWKQWKQTHGTGWQSFAEFLANYMDPTNLDGFWSDWASNIIGGINSVVDWLGLNPDSMTWEDFYNNLSKYAYNSIPNYPIIYEIISFMVRDCSYRVQSYGGWFLPKYHLISAKDFQEPKYELRQLIPLATDDYLLKPLNFDVSKLFNRPFTNLIVLKTWKDDYSLLSEVIENNDISTLYICSPFPSYIQMQLYNILKIKLE